MSMCRGITVRGTPCSLGGSARFGGEWCHHHCSDYFKKQREDMEFNMQLRNDEVKDLNDRLYQLAKKAGFPEADAIKRSLDEAGSNVIKTIKEMTNLFNREISALKEVVHEEGEATRDRVGDVGDTLQNGQVGIAKMIGCLYQKMDQIGDGSSSVLPYNRLRRLIGDNKAYSISPGHMMAISYIDAMTAENISEVFIIKFIEDMLSLNDRWMFQGLNDPHHPDHDSSLCTFNDMTDLLRGKLIDIGRPELTATVDQYTDHYRAIPAAKRLCLMGAGDS